MKQNPVLTIHDVRPYTFPRKMSHTIPSTSRFSNVNKKKEELSRLLMAQLAAEELVVTQAADELENRQQVLEQLAKQVEALKLAIVNGTASRH